MKSKFLISVLLSVFSFSCKKEQVDLLIQEISTNTTYQLHDVFFINDSIGFICGGSRYQIGIFLRTTNAGRTWSIPDSILPKCAYSNFFFSEAEGLVGGYDSWLAYTADSGKTFSVGVGDYIPINEITFYNRNYGVMVGGGGYATGYIKSTSDGGTNWTKTIYANTMSAVQFADSITAFASGYGVIYKSTDRGQTFVPLDVRGDFFVALDFPTTTTGYFAGYQGMILKTTDGGSSFRKAMGGNTFFERREHFESIKFWNEDEGYVVGHAGTMYKTADGGDTWLKVKSFTSENLRDIHLFSSTSGIIVGDNGKIFLFRE